MNNLRTARKLARFIVVFFALSFVLSVFSSSSFAAKRSKLTPADLSQQVQKEAAGYKKCRQEVLTNLKNKKIDKKDVTTALNVCRESFPGVSLYTECKKNAVKATDKEKQAEGIKKCKRLLMAGTFDPTQPVPVLFENKKVFLAGIGLNDPMTIKSMPPPNFDCKNVKDALQSDEKAEYILFGNHPSSFAGFADLSIKKLLKPIGPAKGKEKQAAFKIDGLGRLFGDVKSKTSSLFFPSASCIFNRSLGDAFAGISVYYLIDYETKTAIPYFGILFYKKKAPSVVASKVIETFSKYLGEGYKVVSKNNEVSFIAADTLSQFDEEGDPQNVCRKPREHHIIGAVKFRDGDASGSDSPQYLLLANIKNLCDHGDRLTRRLVTK